MVAVRVRHRRDQEPEPSLETPHGGDPRQCLDSVGGQLDAEVGVAKRCRRALAHSPSVAGANEIWCHGLRSSACGSTKRRCRSRSSRQTRGPSGRSTNTVSGTNSHRSRSTSRSTPPASRRSTRRRVPVSSGCSRTASTPSSGSPPCSPPFLLAAPDYDVQLLLATQVADEHRHIESVLRVYSEVLGFQGGIQAVKALADSQLDPVAATLYDALDGVVRALESNRDEDTFLRAVIAYHVIAEGSIGRANQRF